MDILKNVEKATVGTITLNVDKPEPGKLVIQQITLWTKKTFNHARIYGWLDDPVHGANRKGLFNKIIPQNTMAIATMIWEGSIEWVEGWRLHITTQTQTAGEVLHYTISYDKEPLPKKPGWWLR